MTPKQALETLEGVEHHGSLGEAGDALKRLIHFDAAVHTLLGALVENRADVGGSLEIAVSGNGQSFAVYLNGTYLSEVQGDLLACAVDGAAAIEAAAEALEQRKKP